MVQYSKYKTNSAGAGGVEYATYDNGRQKKAYLNFFEDFL